MEKTYVDFRMDEWGMAEQFPSLQSAIRRVLNELKPEALLALKDPRLEVRFVSEGYDYAVWAYFPIHRNRRIFKKLQPPPKPETRVLLVFHAWRKQQKDFEEYLRDHIGHVLLYLRDPKANNNCAAAEREWVAMRKPRKRSGRKLPSCGSTAPVEAAAEAN
jgi:hypothetical protein